MRYGLYLTIDGGKEMILVGEYRMKRDAIDAMKALSQDEEKVRMQAKGKDVTCHEVLDHDNYTTEEFIPMV